MDAQGSNEDDLTMKLSEITHINNVIKTSMEKGANVQLIMEEWEYLQLHVMLFYLHMNECQYLFIYLCL
jgi:DNA-directed RNA polymerase III subunit RPC1